MKKKQINVTRFIICLALIGFLPAGSINSGMVQKMNIFSMPVLPQAGIEWKSAQKVPPVQYESYPSGGLRFPCLFKDTGLKRIFFDCQMTLDLSSYSILELQLSCFQPDAIRRIGLYLKSGNGWYFWFKPLQGYGRQKLVFPLNQASTEGKPAGWDKINSIRLSFTRASELNTIITAYSLCAKSCNIVIIKGTASVPDMPEKSVAEQTALRLSRWLTELGISHAVLDDSDVIAGKLRSASIALLPYNPFPTHKEIAKLSTFIESGGKLLVFYSSSSQLAHLMHMKLGSYQLTELPGRWSSFKFNRMAPTYMPNVVYQESNNIKPVYPAASDARIIAYWYDANGKRLSDPAWVESAHGFWMSHILRSGDDESKKTVLLGLLCELSPTAWKEVATHSLLNAGKLASFLNVHEACLSISQKAEGMYNEQLVRNLLAHAVREFNAMHKEALKKNYPEVVKSSRVLRANLLEAYGRVQKPVTNEFCAVWDHSGTGIYPGSWEKTCRILARAGITAVFPNMLWSGVAHYPSDVVRESSVCKVYGDQLKSCIQAAHKNGLKVHVWKVCWNLGNLPEEVIRALEKEGRLQQSDTGKTLSWLCPSHPENVAMELKAISELITRYHIDGVHLDYVRYPGKNACYCPMCKQQFEQWMGRKIANWPDSVKKGKLQDSYIAWRSSQMTDFVRSAHHIIKKLKPDIQVSVAVYPDYPACKKTLGQDWALWLKKGYVDFVCPMNYVPDMASFRMLLRRQLKLPQAKYRIFPGIGVTTSRCRLRADEVIDRINCVREEGAMGFILFDLNRNLENEILPILSLGATKSR